jgi:phosphoribosyl-ATP pyrophosphohydrolase/phosphoribosyl-AMP cyclohydrolase
VTTHADLTFDDRGLLPVVVQDADSGLVLMLAYANAEAIKRTLNSGTTWFWSRSREEYWNKGATSGNVQKVVDVRYDCDGDAVLYLVEPAGPACHTGETTCFHRALSAEGTA